MAFDLLRLMCSLLHLNQSLIFGISLLIVYIVEFGSGSMQRILVSSVNK